jgi:hypothetical protein
VNIISKKRKTGKELRIRWYKLIGNKEKEFIKKVKEKSCVEYWGKYKWGLENNDNLYKNIAKEIVDEIKSSRPENKELWWSNEENQRIVSN